MSEFDHTGIIGTGICIDSWGAGPFVIVVGETRWRFEDSDRFGPLLINRRGEPLSNPYPPERSRFWRAHRIWVRQGRRTEDGVTCIWDEPKPTKYHKIGRDRFIVENGEEDGKFVEIKKER